MLRVKEGKEADSKVFIDSVRCLRSAELDGSANLVGAGLAGKGVVDVVAVARQDQN